MRLYREANIPPLRCGVYGYRLRVSGGPVGTIHSVFEDVPGQDAVCLNRVHYAYPEETFPERRLEDGRYILDEAFKGWFVAWGMTYYTRRGEGPGFYGYRNIRMDIDKMRWVYNGGEGRFEDAYSFP